MKKRKKFPLVKYLLISFFSIVFLSGVAMVYLDRIYSKLNNNNLEILGDTSGDNNQIKLSSGILNVLVIGLDELQEKFRGRSDAIMIISADARHKKIKVVSLMRDIWLSIPGHGEGKLNWVYAKGGISLLSSVILNRFGVKIDKYVIVDFKRFEDIIDQLGGIDLSLTEKEVKFINHYSSSKKKLTGSGLMHLDGNQVLQFARDRDDPSADFARTERQRKVVKNIIEQMKYKILGHEKGLLEISFTLKNIAQSMKTNFTMAEILSLSKMAKEFSGYNVSMICIPSECVSGVRNGHSVLLPNLKECREILTNFIYENG